MAEKIDIWLDCDPGLDDILAIIYAGYAPKINIVGITTSPGNSSLQNTTRNALDMLHHIGRRDIQVYAGSNQLINGEMRLAQHVHGENGLGGVQLQHSPVSAIVQNGLHQAYRKIMDNQRQIIWVNTGSLTNLCLMLLTYPLLKAKLKQIVIMGGAIGEGNTTPAAQFNIYFDPTALKTILALKGDIPFVMIPLEVTHLNIAGQDVYNKFKEYSSHPFGLALYNTMLVYQDFYVKVNKIPYPPYHDPLTIFYILHPEQFETKKAIVDVDLYPTSYGRTNIIFSLPGVQKLNSTTYVTTNLFNKNIKFWDQLIKIMDDILSEETQKKIGIIY